MLMMSASTRMASDTRYTKNSVKSKLAPKLSIQNTLNSLFTPKTHYNEYYSTYSTELCLKNYTQTII